MIDERMSFDTIWMLTAETVSKRGTCPRLAVGAVITCDNKIVATGYNGAPRALTHCLEAGCLIEPETGRCKRTVHAEANALLQAGMHASGGTIYCTHYPCRECANLILNSGIERVVYGKSYSSQDTLIAVSIAEDFYTANVIVDFWEDLP
jgi:dCMP deaminase